MLNISFYIVCSTYTLKNLHVLLSQSEPVFGRMYVAPAKAKRDRQMNGQRTK